MRSSNARAKELLKVLEIGHVLNVTIGKYGGSWNVQQFIPHVYAVEAISTYPSQPSPRLPWLG